MASATCSGSTVKGCSGMPVVMPEQPFTVEPEQVAEAIVTGLQHNAEIVYAPSILRYVFGVFRVLPRRVWRIVAAR